MTPEGPPLMDLAEAQREMPPRSRLFNLMPEGLGTWRVESLASYLGRLAFAHGVKCRTLATRVISRSMVGRENRLHERGWDEKALPSCTPVTRAWFDSLSALSPRNDLEALTLSALEGVISTRGLIHNNRRWCPNCVSEDLKQGIPYGYLIWEIAAFEACPVHGIRLIDRCTCGYLGNRNHPIESMVSRCPKCGDHFHQMPAEAPTKVSFSEICRSQILLDALESEVFLHRRHRLPTNGFSNFLGRLFTRLKPKGPGELAQLVRFDKASLHGWKHQQHLPTLEAVIRFAETYDLSLLDVLSGAGEPKQPIPKPVPPKSPPRYQRQSTQRKLEALQKISAELHAQNAKDRIPTLAALARIARISRGTLVVWFPTFAMAHSRARSEQRLELAKSKMQMRIDEFRTVAKRLAELGINPNRSRVSSHLSGHGVWMVKERALCDAICAEVRQQIPLAADTEVGLMSSRETRPGIM